MTFHAACARILRAEAERLGYTRQFTIYDQADARRLTKRCADAVGVDPKRFTPAAHPQPDLGRQEPAARRRRLPPARSARRSRRWSPTCTSSTSATCMRMNAMDFDDLLFRDGQPARAVRGGARALRDAVPPRARRRVPGHQPRPVPAAAAARRRRARAAARAASRAIDRPTRGRSAIATSRSSGDDAQSIYSFRGADIRNILDFQDDFPDARVVKLEQNYRSTETILSAANAVIANNRGGIAKRLWSELGQGDPIQRARARRRARRGALRRRRDRAAASTRAPRARRSPSSTARTRCRG